MVSFLAYVQNNCREISSPFPEKESQGSSFSAIFTPPGREMVEAQKMAVGHSETGCSPLYCLLERSEDPTVYVTILFRICRSFLYLR